MASAAIRSCSCNKMQQRLPLQRSGRVIVAKCNKNCLGSDPGIVLVMKLQKHATNIALATGRCLALQLQQPATNIAFAMILAAVWSCIATKNNKYAAILSLFRLCKCNKMQHILPLQRSYHCLGRIIATKYTKYGLCSDPVV